VLRAPDGPRDDLKAIRGIGPGLEQALNALGVFHYCQLAGLTSEEIDWLGKRLGSFPGRIRKDRWPAQARRLFAASPAKSAKPAKRKRRGKSQRVDEIGA
jgi:predicted flap endonuclease-1-like 5' DNA nuclease